MTPVESAYADLTESAWVCKGLKAVVEARKVVYYDAFDNKEVERSSGRIRQLTWKILETAGDALETAQSELEAAEIRQHLAVAAYEIACERESDDTD